MSLTPFESHRLKMARDEAAKEPNGRLAFVLALYDGAVYARSRAYAECVEAVDAMVDEYRTLGDDASVDTLMSVSGALSGTGSVCR